jgi:hypothetical protein
MVGLTQCINSVEWFCSLVGRAYTCSQALELDEYYCLFLAERIFGCRLKLGPCMTHSPSLRASAQGIPIVHAARYPTATAQGEIPWGKGMG